MENFITVRVFFKILDDANYDLTKKLFMITGEESINERKQHPAEHNINVNNEAEIYIDVNLNCY
jgi:hypothetical protein